MKLYIKILLTFSFVHLSLSYGSDTIEPLFGSEFTFTNEEVIADGKKQGDYKVSSPSNKKVLKEWMEIIKVNCPECTITEKKDKFRLTTYHIQHPSDWWFQISLDPWVVETQMKPMTIEETEKNQILIQSLLFDTAKKAGVTPHERIGGGHIHIDYEKSFYKNPQLFRNFIVDFQNHPYVALGAIGDMPDNAPPLAVLSQTQKRNFKEVIEEFDQSNGSMSIEDLTNNLFSFVYNRNLMNWRPFSKYQAINLDRIHKKELDLKDKTVEIRSLRPQKSVAHYIKILKLMRGKLNHLNTLSNYKIPYKKQDIKIDLYNLRTKQDSQTIVDDFYDYVTSSNLGWDEYVELLPVNLRDMTPTALKDINCNEEPSNSLLKEVI